MSININARGFVTNGDALPSFPSKKAVDAYLQGVCGDLTASICPLPLVCVSFSARVIVFSGWPLPMIEQVSGPGPAYFHPTWVSSNGHSLKLPVGPAETLPGLHGWLMAPLVLSQVLTAANHWHQYFYLRVCFLDNPIQVTGFVWDSPGEASTNTGSTGWSQSIHLSFICIQLCFLGNVLGHCTLSLNFSSLIWCPQIGLFKSPLSLRQSGQHSLEGKWSECTVEFSSIILLKGCHQA